MASSPKRKFIDTKEVLDQAYAAEIEYKLNVVWLTSQDDQTCAVYLTENRERLLPKMVATAIEQGKDADEVVHRFIKGVHKRHEEGLPLS